MLRLAKSAIATVTASTTASAQSLADSYNSDPSPTSTPVPENTSILLTDLIPIRHGDAKLSVDSKRVKSKGVVLGYRGIVKVEFPKTPQANYVVAVEGDALRTCDVDATADAIELRKGIIAQNKITSPATIGA